MPKRFHIEMPFALYNRAMLDAHFLWIAELLVNDVGATGYNISTHPCYHAVIFL